MELNREQIIKALGCCTRGRKNKEDRPCLECPYNECNLVGGTSERQVTGTCQGWLMKDALSLINNLINEIEERKKLYVMMNEEICKLRAVNEAWQKLSVDTKESADKAYYNLACEVEDLRAENERLRDTAYRLECEVHRERADTVREMQERLTKEFDRMHKSNFLTVEVRQWIIDQIAKEMVEGIE